MMVSTDESDQEAYTIQVNEEEDQIEENMVVQVSQPLKHTVT